MGGLLKAELRKAQTCTIARVLVIVPFIVVFLALSALRVQGQDSTVQVVIESAILEPDFQPGMKSRHVVQVDFAGRKVIDVAETGVTELLGTQWNSIRDNFRVLGRVDKRDSQSPLSVIQAGICDGDQLGTRPDVGR